MNKYDTITDIIKGRRAVFPTQYIDQEITDETILQILENANWAPSHRKTEPWRFKIFKSKEALQALGEFNAEFYKENTSEEKFSQVKYNKNIKKTRQSSAVIAICMKRDAEARIPEWEEEAAVACAVQNMWLTCHSLGIGAYWSSPKAIYHNQELLKLQEGEKCLGYFYMGYYDTSIDLPAERGDIQQKIEWM